MWFARPYAFLRSSPARFARSFSHPSSSRSILGPLLSVLSAGAAVVYIRDHYFDVMRVAGPSMYPTLNSEFHTSTRKTSVLVNKHHQHLGRKLERGMVVAFWSPTSPEKMVTKRIIGIPGDEVTTRKPYPFSQEQVPFGYVWVEGENPDGRKSYDSNSYGPISTSLIVGEVKAVVWPWSQRTWVKWQDYRPTNTRVSRNKFPVEAPEVYY